MDFVHHFKFVFFQLVVSDEITNTLLDLKQSSAWTLNVKNNKIQNT